MPTNDWMPAPPSYEFQYFSANGVPYPLDDYLKLTGQPTTDEMAEVVKRWGKR